MQPSTDRFLQDLERAASHYEWEVVQGQVIRTTPETGPKDRRMCPLEAVHHYKTGDMVSALTLCYEHFDYLNELAKRYIMMAADDPDSTNVNLYPELHEKLRNRMLEILSLEDTS